MFLGVFRCFSSFDVFSAPFFVRGFFRSYKSKEAQLKTRGVSNLFSLAPISDLIKNPFSNIGYFFVPFFEIGEAKVKGRTTTYSKPPSKSTTCSRCYYLPR